MIAAVGVLLTACSSQKVVTVERVRTDTLRETRNIRDSIYLHDSVFINQYERGETVFVEKERWRVRLENHLTHDTTYISRVDSVPVPYPQEILRERELTWWQRLRMHAGDVLLMAVVGAVVFWVIRLKRGIF